MAFSPEEVKAFKDLLYNTPGRWDWIVKTFSEELIRKFLLKVTGGFGDARVVVTGDPIHEWEAKKNGVLVQHEQFTFPHNCGLASFLLDYLTEDQIKLKLLKCALNRRSSVIVSTSNYQEEGNGGNLALREENLKALGFEVIIPWRTNPQHGSSIQVYAFKIPI